MGGALLVLDNLPASTVPLLDSAEARNIGRAFASAYPDADEIWGGSPPGTIDEWGARIGEMIRDDLDADRTVEIDGWWLTETEVRFCVYVHSLRG